MKRLLEKAPLLPLMAEPRPLAFAGTASSHRQVAVPCAKLLDVALAHSGHLDRAPRRNVPEDAEKSSTVGAVR